MCNQCLIMFGEVREGQFYSLLFEYRSLHSEHCQTLLTCLVTEEARAPDPPWTSPLTTSSECRILCLTMPVTCRGWTIVNSWYDYQVPSELILYMSWAYKVVGVVSVCQLISWISSNSFLKINPTRNLNIVNIQYTITNKGKIIPARGCVT